MKILLVESNVKLIDSKDIQWLGNDKKVGRYFIKLMCIYEIIAIRNIVVKPDRSE